MEGLFESEEDYLDETFGDDWYDVTDNVKCYENGKTFECECGQGFGVDFDTTMQNCPSCPNVCVDMEPEKRGPPDREDDQSALTNWT